MIEPQIRPALADDVDSLGRLGALLVQEHHDFDGRRFLPAAANTPELYGSFLRTQLTDPDGVVLVAEHEAASSATRMGPSKGTTSWRCAGRRLSCTTSSWMPSTGVAVWDERS